MYSLKLELKMNNKERSLLYGCAGFGRLVYNCGLSILTQSWQFEGITASAPKRLAEIDKVFTNHAKTQPDNSWMKGYRSAIYSSALRNLDKAIQGWRLGKSGFSQFKSKKRGDSFTSFKKSGVYPAKGEAMMPFTNRQFRPKGKRITIAGWGNFRLKQARPFLGSSQTFSISRTADKWFVSFALDIDKIPPRVHQVQSAGIDLDVKCLTCLSDASFIVAPQILKTAKTKLSQEQWHNRNKQLGNRRQEIRASNNALKYYYRKLARRHADIANFRRNFLQKTTTDLSRKYYQIRMEDLNISGMMANQKLALAISSLGLDEFGRMLTYKAAFLGTKLEQVDRWFPSSKICSCCGNIRQRPLKEPVYSYNRCGVSINRDLKAAIINLENGPKTLVRAASAELTPVNQKMPSSLLEAGSKRQFKPNARFE
ncbi:transposase [Microcoleus sp. ARI1-B5]|uniref:RNA-guided endonuclease InsQ/TnpB family protein n=1 Tax=unclassified Microcoleus TaxID=2642155 RepID=UPI002FD36F5E